MATTTTDEAQISFSEIDDRIEDIHLRAMYAAAGDDGINEPFWAVSKICEGISFSAEGVDDPVSIQVYTDVLDVLEKVLDDAKIKSAEEIRAEEGDEEGD